MSSLFESTTTTQIPESVVKRERKIVIFFLDFLKKQPFFFCEIFSPFLYTLNPKLFSPPPPARVPVSAFVLRLAASSRPQIETTRRKI